MVDACTGVYINPKDDGGNGNGDDNGDEDGDIVGTIRENAVPITASLGIGAIAYSRMRDGE